MNTLRDLMARSMLQRAGPSSGNQLRGLLSEPRPMNAPLSGGLLGPWGQPPQGGADPSIAETVKGLYEDYPGLLPMRVDDQRQKKYSAQDFTGNPAKPRVQSEYFSPEERNNPFPGERTVQVYNPEFTGERLRSLLFGENFHALGQEDAVWRDMKKRFYELLPPQDKDLLARKYARLVESGQEKRPFERWLDVSELDQWMGGMLNPPNEEWRRVQWSPEHKSLADEMIKYLKTPRR